MKLRRLIWILCGLLVITWVGVALTRSILSNALAARIGEGLIRASEGKISEPSIYILNRINDALFLGFFAFLIILLIGSLNGFYSRKPWFQSFGWIIQSIMIFLGINIWLSIAGQKNLFWAVLTQGADTHNLARFYFKKTLLAENKRPSQAILMGSSQTRAQIEEGYLNTLLGEKLFTTELHYPSSRCYDLLLTLRHIDSARMTNVICYLSESYFYLNTYSLAFPYFFRANDWSEALKIGALKHNSGRAISYAALGQVMALFRFREVLAQRFLGVPITQIEQNTYNTQLATDLEQRAISVALDYRQDDQSRFQMQALEQFVIECERRGLRLVICCGQLNPVLSRHLNPSMRAEMVAWLKDLQKRHSKMVLWFQEDLLIQTEKDYADLTHVTPDCQQAFTRRLAGLLQTLNQSEDPQQVQTKTALSMSNHR